MSKVKELLEILNINEGVLDGIFGGAPKLALDKFKDITSYVKKITKTPDMKNQIYARSYDRHRPERAVIVMSMDGHRWDVQLLPKLSLEALKLPANAIMKGFGSAEKAMAWADRNNRSFLNANVPKLPTKK